MPGQVSKKPGLPANNSYSSDRSLIRAAEQLAKNGLDFSRDSCNQIGEDFDALYQEMSFLPLLYAARRAWLADQVTSSGVKRILKIILEGEDKDAIGAFKMLCQLGLMQKSEDGTPNSSSGDDRTPFAGDE